VVQARSAAECAAAVASCQAQLAGTQASGAGAGEAQTLPRTNLAMGQAGLSGANMAQISVPGPYAAAEALKAIKLGMHVFLFSDNVPLAQEAALKQEATRRGLLVMGPDCGTAIIGGVPLGFANAVRRSNIGLVAASGTGLQEVSTQIHRMGGGVSHAIGTGGRDVYEEVGGATMLQAIGLLAADPGTKVIAIVSKPPAPAVAERVLAALKASGKPSVVLFLGATASAPQAGKGAALRIAHTLVDCAAMAVRLAGVKRQAPAHYALPRKPVFSKSQKSCC
jgi:succinyl-CoA synthetase alpha subunit